MDFRITYRYYNTPGIQINCKAQMDTWVKSQLSAMGYSFLGNTTRYYHKALPANAIAGFVKTEMEYYINNELGANLARVSTQVGTNPGAGVKQWDPNCK